MANQEGQFVYVNHPACDILGYSQEELLSRKIFDIEDIFPVSSWEEHWQKLKSSGNLIVESSYRTKQGKIFPVEIHETYIEFEGQEYNCTFVEDITKRRESEEILRKNERFLSDIFNSIQDGISILGLDLTVLRVNSIMEKWYSSNLPLVGRKCHTCYHASDRICDPCPSVRCLSSGKPESEIVRGIPGATAVEWIELYSYPMKNPKTGEITGVLEFVRDITHRKKAEMALEASENTFRTLFNNMSEGVALHEVIMDAEGKPIDYRFIDVNPAYQRHTGIFSSNVIGRLGTEVYGTEKAAYLDVFSKVAMTGIPYVFDTYFPPLKRHFHVSVVCHGENRFATVFEDITERKQKERELQEKNAELERFTYTVSHDLRSPLITIKGFLGIMEQDLLSGKRDQVLLDMKRISDAADKMENLLRDLLELSRIGRIVSKPVKISSEKLFQDAIELLSGLIKTKEIHIQLHPGLPFVYGDSMRLLQVIQNLLENAIKYMGQEKKPFIEIGIIEEYSEKIFWIKDNGIGIDPKYHENIFGLFNKLDARTEGTGIGLALARRIIEVHGGRIWLESEGLGKGSTFFFTLPCSES